MKIHEYDDDLTELATDYWYINAKENYLDLSPFAEKSYGKIIVGKDSGRLARKTLGLNGKDRDQSTYIIMTSTAIWCTTESFILGLFEDSIRKLGGVAFKEKYIFQCKEPSIEDIDWVISRIEWKPSEEELLLKKFLLGG